MKRHGVRSIVRTLLLLLCMSLAAGRAVAAEFQGLGDLTAGTRTVPADISADGSTVVGYWSDPTQPEVPWGQRGDAFRWTAQSGIVTLGDLPVVPSPICPEEDFPCVYSTIDGVSEDGSMVVGTTHYCSGIVAGEYSGFYEFKGKAFAWTETGGTVELCDGVLNAASADASVVVGNESDSDYYGGFGGGGFLTNTWAFRWTAETGRVDVGCYEENKLRSRATDVSADGSVVVGTCEVSVEFSVDWGSKEAFRWTAEDGMVFLGDLPGGRTKSVPVAVSADGSTVVGRSGSALGYEPFRWTEAEGMVGLGFLPGGGGDAHLSEVDYAVSADGSVVTGECSSSEGYRAFRWTAAEGMVGLDDFPGGFSRSRVSAMSADGSVMVGTGNSDRGWEAFYWTESDGMRSLRDVLTDDYGLDLTGWELSGAADISADGTVIVGSGHYLSSDERQAWRAVIPEPSTLMLLLSGWFGLAIYLLQRPVKTTSIPTCRR